MNAYVLLSITKMPNQTQHRYRRSISFYNFIEGGLTDVLQKPNSATVRAGTALGKSKIITSEKRI